MQLAQAQSFLNFLACTFVPELNVTYLEFQYMAAVSVSMATRSRDLDDQKSGVNVQTQTLTPPSG